MDFVELGDVDKGDELPGRPVSLWLATTPETRYPSLSGDVSVDAAVLGGGITGIATAYLLQQSGMTVALLDAGRVVESVTGNTTAKVTSQHGLVYDRLVSDFGEERARLYGEAQEAAKEKIASLVEGLGIDCDFRWASAYTYTLDEGEKGQVEKEVEAAKRLGLPASYTEETELPFRVRAAVRSWAASCAGTARSGAGTAPATAPASTTPAGSARARPTRTWSPGSFGAPAASPQGVEGSE